jgi:oligopeptide/dipeptide ABC transporter ATP-binding protein
MKEAQQAKLLTVSNLGVVFTVRGHALARKRAAISAVHGVSFSINAGEVVALVGESGSGKSTIAKCVAGLVPATDGEIELLGQRLATKRARDIRRKIQVVFQDPFASLNPRRRVRHALSAPLRVHRTVRRKDEENECLRLLRLVGLVASRETLGKYPHAFSGGELQRIAIARAIAPRPSLIVADEPTASLDVSIRAQVIKLFDRIRRDSNIGILFITHDLVVARSLSDRVLVLYLGQIVEEASAVELFSAPAHPYTRLLLAAKPAPAVTSRRRRQVIRGEMPDAASPPNGCRFHPRCPARQPICEQAEPPIVKSPDGGWSRCHFAPEIKAQSWTENSA